MFTEVDRLYADWDASMHVHAMVGTFMCTCGGHTQMTIRIRQDDATRSTLRTLGTQAICLLYHTYLFIIQYKYTTSTFKSV